MHHNSKGPGAESFADTSAIWNLSYPSHTQVPNAVSSGAPRQRFAPGIILRHVSKTDNDTGGSSPKPSSGLKFSSPSPRLLPFARDAWGSNKGVEIYSHCKVPVSGVVSLKND